MVKVFIGRKQMRTSALKLYSLGFRQLNTRSLKAEGPNQAFKLPRLSVCLLGGRASAHNLAMPCSCISLCANMGETARSFGISVGR
jgi:hypothetical protein